ncbi:glucosidase II beta subunit-like protein-domain-containing protein [Podospora australis]|uniref:Endoplasmic reticulum lectin n=1 Tax=Podospora australis TaxID=1536484 RepID=A0AAN7AGN5_9PEZI|nr:glucosidase II beta subunit-like protein-domain-containing protein [Podospora australis]
MRRLNLILLVSLQLCTARQPSFSINDDLLAHPQFEVLFSDQFISESDALALLSQSPPSAAGAAPAPSSSGSTSSQTDLANTARESAPAAQLHNAPIQDDIDDDEIPISHTYELINSGPWRYLCNIPVIAPPPILNRTATALAKAEEQRELSKASLKGWELMSGLDGHCLYFVNGWWSYSFCYGKEVVQFHALPREKGDPSSPPVRDEQHAEYVLGRMHAPKSQKQKQAEKKEEGEGADKDTKSLALPPPNSELQTKGDQRYLLQRFEHGTICDLTGRPRTIEIQYHCNPNASGDRIGWIKEVTTCTYLMVVQTPRLCDEVSFLPPKPSRRHAIDCRQIVSNEEEEASWRYRKRVEAGEFLGLGQGQHAKHQLPKDQMVNQYSGLSVGGVVVGGQKVLGGTTKDGKPGFKMTTPRIPGIGDRIVKHVLLSKEGLDAEVKMMSAEKLKELNIDQELVDEMLEKMEAANAGKAYGWRLEAVEMGGQWSFVAYEMMDPEEKEGEEDVSLDGMKKPPPSKKKDGDLPEQKKKSAKKTEPSKEKKKKPTKQQKDRDQKEEEGSKEEFKVKEEL